MSEYDSDAQWEEWYATEYEEGTTVHDVVQSVVDTIVETVSEVSSGVEEARGTQASYESPYVADPWVPVIPTSENIWAELWNAVLGEDRPWWLQPMGTTVGAVTYPTQAVEKFGGRSISQILEDWATKGYDIRPFQWMEPEDYEHDPCKDAPYFLAHLCECAGIGCDDDGGGWFPNINLGEWKLFPDIKADDWLWWLLVGIFGIAIAVVIYKWLTKKEVVVRTVHEAK